MKQPGIGMLAVCSSGMIGIITMQDKQPVTYSDGNTGWAYVGVHLTPGRIGHKWSSRNPRVICHISEVDDIVGRLEGLEK